MPCMEATYTPTFFEIWIEQGKTLREILPNCTMKERKSILIKVLKALSVLEQKHLVPQEYHHNNFEVYQDTPENIMHIRYVPTFEKWKLSEQRENFLQRDPDEAKPNQVMELNMQARLLSFILHNQNVDTKVQLEQLVLDFIFDHNESLLASLLKGCLEQPKPFSSMMNNVLPLEWSATNWLNFNTEVSNFLVGGAAGSRKLRDNLNDLAELYFPLGSHNWVKSLDPQLFVLLAHPQRPPKEVPIGQSADSPQTSTPSNQSLVKLELDFDGKKVHTALVMGRNLVEHRDSKKKKDLVELERHVGKTNAELKLFLEQNISPHYFQATYLETLGAQEFLRSKSHLYHSSSHACPFPTMTKILCVSGRYIARKVDKFTQPTKSTRKRTADQIGSSASTSSINPVSRLEEA